MGYSSDTLVNIGLHSNTSLSYDCFDRINDLGIQRNIKATHRGKRNVIDKSLHARNLSPNIGLSIDVRVTQRPSLHQCSTYRPDQLISINHPNTVHRIKKSSTGANISNLISLTSSRTKSMDKAVFGLTNARSLRKNHALLKYMVQSEKCDILSITETWLHDDHYISSEFCPEGYDLLREDRVGQRGGVAVLCRADYKPK